MGLPMRGWLRTQGFRLFTLPVSLEGLLFPKINLKNLSLGYGLLKQRHLWNREEISRVTKYKSQTLLHWAADGAQTCKLDQTDPGA